MLTTHFTQILVGMLVLISCIIEGKEVYFPQLIMRFMWRAHIRSTLAFPTLVTEMVQQASVPWLADDVSSPPPVLGKEELIP
ncbi:hypothetical protein AHAS_Ahas05G0147500 [Arachis hypogaea]